jgi:hypothetical protein
VSARHFHRLAVEALTITLAAGCVPISAPIPLHLAETATPLQRGELRATAGGGGGVMGLDGGGGGGDVRLRIGVGARQEVGVEGELLRVDTGKPDNKSPRWIGKSFVYGLKVSWKGAPTDWFAVIAGAGAMSAATGESAGADLALVFSRPVGIVRPYAGFRGTIAFPVARPLADAGGITGGLVVPGGLSFHFTSRADLFLEGGWTQLWSDGGQHEHGGGYCLLALAYAFMP